MDAVQLVSIGLVYFMLQFVGVRYLKDGWYLAAILAAPLLATLIAFGIVGTQLNIPGSGWIMAWALPIGIAYLTFVMTARVIAQAFQQQSES